MPSDPSDSQRVRVHMNADHAEIDRLFVELGEAYEAGEPDRTVDRWNALDRKVVAHFRAEEYHLVPTLVPTNQRAAAAILAEHRHLRARMAELREKLFTGVAHPRAVRGVLDEFRAHCAHEMRVLYPWADATTDGSVSGPLLQALEVAPSTDSSADSSSSTCTGFVR